MRVNRFEDMSSINESVLGGILKGALSKVMSMFGSPFKDLINDMKKFFKADDPSSIKNIIMTNFDQAIDAAQKEIDSITDETALSSIIDAMVTKLAELGVNIGKDIAKSGIEKNKINQVTKISQAIILGNKEVNWAGIVGCLDPQNQVAIKYNGGIQTNYKFNKKEYQKVLANTGGKSVTNSTKPKREAAKKFFDNMQIDIKKQLDLEFDENEIEKMFNDGDTTKKTFSEEELSKLKDNKIPVIYLLKDKTLSDYNPKIGPDEQKDIVGVKIIQDIKNGTVIMLDAKGNPVIKKTFDQIVGQQDTKLGSSADKAKLALGKIKNDETKMSQVVSFVDFISDPTKKDQILEVDKLIKQ